MPFNALATDNANRANNSDLGANWTNGYTGGFVNIAISSNAFIVGVNNNFGLESYSGITWPDDQYAQFDIVTWGAGDRQIGAMVRMSPPGGLTAYFLGPANYGSHINEIYRIVSDSYTQLSSNTTAIGAGNVLMGAADGTGLTLYKDGASILTATDSDIASGDAGMWLNGSTSNVVLDNWEGGEITVAGFLAAWARGSNVLIRTL